MPLVEHAIGEAVTYEGAECVVADQHKTKPQLMCMDCALYGKRNCQEVRCESQRRTDKTSVIFIPADKFALMRLKGQIK